MAKPMTASDMAKKRLRMMTPEQKKDQLKKMHRGSRKFWESLTAEQRSERMSKVRLAGIKKARKSK